MNQNTMIKQAAIDDLNDIAALFDKYRFFYKQESDLEGAKAFIGERLANNESIIFLASAHKQKKPIGFTQLYPSFSSVSMKRCWILNDLYVDEKYRGQGAASLLLQKAKSFAIDTNAVGIKLSTGIDNEKAQRLYEQTGYNKDVSFYHYNLTL